MKITLRLRTGDWAIIAGAAAIAAYEVVVRDDEDLISRRVSAYRRNRAGRYVADAVIAATALHLAEALPDDLDIYCWLMRAVRKTAAATEEILLAEV